MGRDFGAGALFPAKARSEFLSLTGSRYENMMKRLVKKKLIHPDHPPFTKEDFRAHMLSAMGGKEDGLIQCRYCRAYIEINDISADHEVPLERQGGIGLDNIGYPCLRCNKQKGKMTPTEFRELLDFLEARLPLARTDVLERLEKAVGFARSFSHTQGMISDLKKSGVWQQTQKARTAAKKAKQGG